MFQDIKHDANRVQDKLRRVFRSREPGTSATGPVIGDPGMHVPQPDPRNGIPLPHLPTATVPPDGAWRPNLAAAASVPATAKRNFKNTPWAGLKTLLDVLNASTDAFSPLKSAVGGFVRCIEIYDNQASAREGYDKLGTQLNDLCQDISGYLGGVAPPGMTPSITSLARGIEEEVQRILRKSQRNAIERYAGAMEDADEILGCYLRIQMHLGRLALNANLNTWKIVDAQATDSRIARLPYSSAAEYRSAESSDLGRNGCTANTRMDLLKHLRMWAEDNKSQRIYWLNGMAGTGKTTVAYSLCEAIENTGKLAASFFCSRQSPECRDVGRILPSIAYQLSLFSRPFRYAISKVLEGNPRAHNQLPKEQFESLIATPLREIGHTLPSDLVIVIDALDECDSASGMNQILTALLTHAPNLPVKVFVTSRPNPNILDQMRSEQAERVRSELRLHELERLVVQSDIKTYLNAELGRLEPLKSTDIDQLVERSGVLFVYAATVVRYLADDNFSRGAQRLKDVLAATTSANGTHEEVDALYTAILEAALDREGVHISEREEMIRVLHTVICAQEPLSVNDIAGLLGLTTESVHANLRPFLSVLQISDSTGLVTTLHESFPDYLFNVERSKQFYCDARRQNAWFTRACFALLKALDPPFNICNLESSYLLDEEVPDLQNRVRNNISPHLFYACRYWEAHIEAAEPSERLNELFDFLSTRLLLWVEIMNLKRDIQGCVGMMSKLNTWLTRARCSSNLRDLARDAWRFVTEFALGETRRSTPHLYVSALAMWPERSPISVYYSKNISGLTKSSGTAMDRRESVLLTAFDTVWWVHCIAYSPDGARIASDSSESIRIWDAHTGQPILQPLRGHAYGVLSLAYSPDGACIVSGSSDKTIRIWDAHTGELLGRPLKGHSSLVQSVAYSPDSAHIVSASYDKTIRIWDARSGQMIGQPLHGHTDPVKSVAYSPNGARIVSGSSDHTIRIWDAYTGQPIGQPLRGHAYGVSSVAYAPDGARIVSGSLDETIRIWDAHTGLMIGQPLRGHTGPVNSVAYSPNGACIVSASYDKTIRIWDAHTGKPLGQSLQGHTDSVVSAAYSPDGARIASASADKTIRIWDAHTSQMPLGQPLHAHTDLVKSVAYSPNGAHVVSGSHDKTLRIWDAHTGQMLRWPLQGHTHSVWSVTYSPDGARIASGSFDETIRIWDSYTGQALGRPLRGHTGLVRSVAFSPNGAHVVSGSSDNTVRIWDAHTGQIIGQPLQGHTHWVLSVAYSPGGARIVSGSSDKTIRIWDAHTGQMVGQPLQGHTGSVESVTYSPNEARIISGSSDNTIRIWDACTGYVIRQLHGHTGSVWSVKYSPSGARIVSGSSDQTIRIWDARTGQMIGQPLQGHTDLVWSVAYSPDGARIVSGSHDSTIRIWDTRTDQTPRQLIKGGKHRVDLVTRWILDNDGWVVDPRFNRLIWVPPHLRVALLRPSNTLIVCTLGFVKLDFSNAKLGEEWGQCYHAL